MENFYAPLAGSTKRASRIFLGTASLPYTAGKEQNRLLDVMYEAGINAVDTARVYSDAEKCIGKWLASRKNRDKIYLTTKCAHPSPLGEKRVSEREIRNDLETSLSNLCTDHLDCLLLHRDDENVAAGEIAELFNRLIAEGKILSYGVSNWRHERIIEVNGYAAEHNLQGIAISSPHFGLAEQVEDPWGGNCVTVTGKDNKAAREWYRKTQMPLLAYSSLGRGLFSGKAHTQEELLASMDKSARLGYACAENFERVRRCELLAKEKDATVAQIALAWLFCCGLNTFAVTGTSSAERMKENIAAFSLKLTQEECNFLNLEE